MIDFDTASPGPRVWDLAYLAYRLVPLTAPTNPDTGALQADQRAARLRRMCEAYGAATPAGVLDTIPDRLRALAALASDPEHARIYVADAAHLVADLTPSA